MILLALVPIIALGLLLWYEKRDRAIERKAWELERIGLLQRIQAPERAVVDDFEPSDLVQYVPFDDDNAYWKNHEELSG